MIQILNNNSTNNKLRYDMSIDTNIGISFVSCNIVYFSSLQFVSFELHVLKWFGLVLFAPLL